MPCQARFSGLCLSSLGAAGAPDRLAEGRAQLRWAPEGGNEPGLLAGDRRPAAGLAQWRAIAPNSYHAYSLVRAFMIFPGRDLRASGIMDAVFLHPHSKVLAGLSPGRIFFSLRTRRVLGESPAHLNRRSETH